METSKEIDITKLSASEIEQYLADKKKEERKEQNAKRKAYETKRDDFIKLSVATAQESAAQLKALKKDVIARGNALHEAMYEIFDKEHKDLKKFPLITEDGKLKLVIESVDRQQLNETAEVHIAAIKTVLSDKFAARNQVMYKIMNDILIKNNAGDYDEKLVAKLRKHELAIDDVRFSAALDGLAQAYYTTGTATYARFYEKNEDGKTWDHINIQFSSL